MLSIRASRFSPFRVSRLSALAAGGCGLVGMGLAFAGVGRAGFGVAGFGMVSFGIAGLARQGIAAAGTAAACWSAHFMCLRIPGCFSCSASAAFGLLLHASVLQGCSTSPCSCMFPGRGGARAKAAHDPGVDAASPAGDSAILSGELGISATCGGDVGTIWLSICVCCCLIIFTGKGGIARLCAGCGIVAAWEAAFGGDSGICGGAWGIAAAWQAACAGDAGICEGPCGIPAAWNASVGTDAGICKGAGGIVAAWSAVAWDAGICGGACSIVAAWKAVVAWDAGVCRGACGIVAAWKAAVAWDAGICKGACCIVAAWKTAFGGDAGVCEGPVTQAALGWFAAVAMLAAVQSAFGGDASAGIVGAWKAALGGERGICSGACDISVMKAAFAGDFAIGACQAACRGAGIVLAWEFASICGGAACAC